jgi:hypothetical protein
MTDPARVGDARPLVLVAWSGEDSQREDSHTGHQGHQRRDGMPEMGGPLARWPASVPKHQAAENPGQQQRTSGEQHRGRVGHGGMVAHG